jgi:hypothetical protein
MLGVGAYVTYTLNLWGPMFNMANAASAQALEEGKKRLREFLESSETGRQAIGMTTRDESYEMRSLNSTKSKARSVRTDEDDDDDL